jgi:transcriptional regulator
MTEIPVDPKIWKLAESILTPKQKAILDLRERHGFSWNQLAINYNCSRSNVREIHRAATKNLLDAIENADGDIDLALERSQPRPTSGWKKEIA